MRRSQALPHGRGTFAATPPGDEVFEEDQADDVVRAVVVGGKARLAGRDRHLDRFVDGCLRFDRDHVRPRDHHFTNDGVPELEDGVDELAFLGLDRGFLSGDVGHGQDLALGDERSRP